MHVYVSIHTTIETYAICVLYHSSIHYTYVGNASNVPRRKKIPNKSKKSTNNKRSHTTQSVDEKRGLSVLHARVYAEYANERVLCICTKWICSSVSHTSAHLHRCGRRSSSRSNVAAFVVVISCLCFAFAIWHDACFMGLCFFLRWLVSAIRRYSRHTPSATNQNTSSKNFTDENVQIKNVFMLDVDAEFIHFRTATKLWIQFF